MVKSGESKKDRREADADRRHWFNLVDVSFVVVCSRVKRVQLGFLDLKATYSLPNNPTTGSYLSSDFTAVTFHLLYLSSSTHHGVIDVRRVELGGSNTCIWYAQRLQLF